VTVTQRLPWSITPRQGKAAAPGAWTCARKEKKRPGIFTFKHSFIVSLLNLL